MLAALGWIVGEFVADKKLLVNADGRIGGEHRFAGTLGVPRSGDFSIPVIPSSEENSTE